MLLQGDAVVAQVEGVECGEVACHADAFGDADHAVVALGGRRGFG